MAFFGFGKPGTALGVDIGSSSIKVVQLRNKGGRIHLDTYGALALGPYAEKMIGQAVHLEDEQMIEALKDIIKESKVTTQNSALAIPFQASLMSIISLPASGKKDLSEMVPLEARKYIPVPISEVTLDWSIIPKSKKLKSPASSEPTIDVLLVAIHNDIISQYNDIIKKAPLKNNFFEIEIFSTMRSTIHGDKGPAMVMDMGAESTKLYIVDGQNVRFSHTINRGSQKITDALAESQKMDPLQAETLKRNMDFAPVTGQQNASHVVAIVLDFVLTEAKRVINNFENMNSTKIKKVYLVGGGVSLRGFDKYAAKSLDKEIVMSNPFAHVEAPAFLDGVLRQTGPEFAVAVGLALRLLKDNS